MENLLELKKGYLPTNHAWNEPNVGDVCKFIGDFDECHIGVLTDIDNSAIFKYRSNTSEWCMDAEKITDPNIIKLFSNNG